MREVSAEQRVPPGVVSSRAVSSRVFLLGVQFPYPHMDMDVMINPEDAAKQQVPL